MSYYSGNLFIFKDIPPLNIIDPNYIRPTRYKSTGRIPIVDNCSDIYSWVDSPEYDKYEWIDNSDIVWGICSPELNQVWMDEKYAYVITTLDLSIIDLITKNKVAYIDNRDNFGFTTIWGNNNTIYLGTPFDGLKYIDKTSISGSEGNPFDLKYNLNNYDYTYTPSSNEIKYIHGSNDLLSVVTSDGIDILKNIGSKFKSTALNNNITKCFMTSKGELYYIVQGGTKNGIFKMNYIGCDWETADVDYISGQSFLPINLSVNDVFITENTSDNKIDNTLFVATSSGIYILDEGILAVDSYYTE